jgi:hypothetical protein
MARIGDDWKRWYSALRAAHPDIYSKAIRYSEAQCINHRIEGKAAADIERSYVMFACELMDVDPGPQESDADRHLRMTASDAAGD